MGCRRIIALIRGLSEHSNTAHVVTKGWGYEHELMASLIELVDFGNRNFLLANGVKSFELPQQVFIKRPNAPEKRKATRAETLEIFKGGVRRDGKPINE